MTHPPSAPSQPPRPAGPRVPKAHTHPQVEPLDPDSPEGRQIADDLSQVLAEIELAIERREAATKQAAA
ncbi:hypothetical protein C5N14_13770 [Micromonospora sp. MW-13]|uniref:hypothetical protein n=1 Tax=Micromonospora sp. MW-13 TaxID=2094022 RepID=UPI000E43D2E6|nr:hypothetical protein [Micromonospora sp. MW-13]RGC68394.1 hypothetical protein C5N14_13770 [Micromonospora sp. MW-13]